MLCEVLRGVLGLVISRKGRKARKVFKEILGVLGELGVRRFHAVGVWVEYLTQSPQSPLSLVLPGFPCDFLHRIA